MNRWILAVWVFLVCGFATANEQEEKSLFGKNSGESFEGKVVVLKVGEDSLVNTYAFKYWKKVLKRADEEKAKAVIFDLDTPGGLAFDTADLITQVLPEVKVKTIAFVNTDAISAGSMVAFGCDKIYMHPRGSIGATGLISGSGAEIEPVMRAKLESVFASYVKIVAKEKGRNADVMKAMMFKDKAYSFAGGKVVVEEGDLLTLTGDEAVLMHEGKPLLADGICEDLLAVLAKENLAQSDVVVAEPTGFEAFAYWVAKFSALLIAVGLMGAFLEMKTPGFGIFGGIAILAFTVFFLGNHVADNLAGYELAALFAVGLILVILEFLVIPGTFFAGAVGVVMMLSALLIAMVDRDSFEGFDTDKGLITLTSLIGWPIIFLAIGLAGSTLLVTLFMRFLPSVPLYNSLAVNAELKRGTGIEKGEGEESVLLGVEGVAETELRPVGRAKINGKLLEVVSDVGFIPAGAKIVVTSEDGMRIIVEEIKEA
ncbi:membrane-bound serine protease (ClpP class) [Rubritalea squalenifaciens DSM 18772]|uniref:Membrane-bound serine protease (ClpP class) n=1 Tax=Rubritalea squalenifaciens DSM 18772 TaxID=1123071 RepID=A0A1M6PF87_9BACT|nr:NfeD family protein [Rubritalea squalenifaciens]SHK06591.1 membrane-bound serine protease (ClpP class) [Rubritalea squalenifaciens DSM 18772]